MLVKLHLERDQPLISNSLHELERIGHGIRFINYDGDVVPTDQCGHGRTGPSWVAMMGRYSEY